jgi:hypothetical protein
MRYRTPSSFNDSSNSSKSRDTLHSSRPERALGTIMDGDDALFRGHCPPKFRVELRGPRQGRHDDGPGPPLPVRVLLASRGYHSLRRIRPGTAKATVSLGSRRPRASKKIDPPLSFRAARNVEKTERRARVAAL